MFRSRVSRLVRSFSSAAAAAPAFTRFASSLGTATRVAAGGAVLTAALLSFSPLETAGAKVDYTAVRKVKITKCIRCIVGDCTVSRNLLGVARPVVSVECPCVLHTYFPDFSWVCPLAHARCGGVYMFTP